MVDLLRYHIQDTLKGLEGKYCVEFNVPCRNEDAISDNEESEFDVETDQSHCSLIKTRNKLISQKTHIS